MGLQPHPPFYFHPNPPYLPDPPNPPNPPNPPYTGLVGRKFLFFTALFRILVTACSAHLALTVLLALGTGPGARLDLSGKAVDPLMLPPAASPPC